MVVYRKERIENTVCFFAREHFQKTKYYPSQTVVYKYLAFFEFRYLEKYGDMPLNLEYKAMEHGPVPVGIYNRRGKVQAILFTFERHENYYVIKATGKFNPDYFAETELKEMQNLIEIFAQRWVGASVMSDASHKEIRAWVKAKDRELNSVINPIEEFARDIIKIPASDLTSAEERYLNHIRLAGILV